MDEADQPDLVIDLADPNELAGKDLAEVDFASADADAPAACDPDSFVVIRVFRLGRRLVDSG